MTGGDPISARFLRKEFFSFVPEFKLFFAANHKPEVSGTDPGTWRRVRLIPFTQRWFAQDEKGEPKRDETLGPRLKRDELPGILAWAVQGCLDWQTTGLLSPDLVLAATQEYRSESDSLGRFLIETCDCSDVAGMTEAQILAEGRYVPSSELYSALQA